MAEPSDSEIKQLAEIFIPAYNESHSTNFIWDDNRSLTQPEPSDFSLFDEDRELTVQLKRAPEDDQRDFVRPKRAQTVIDHILNYINEQNIRGFSLYVNFMEQPTNVEDAEKLAYWIIELLKNKLSDRLTTNYIYRYNFVHDVTYLEKFKEYLSEIEIRWQPDDDRWIAWGTSKTVPEPLFDDAQRVTRQISKVEKKYHDIVLLIDSYSSPISNFYIPIIQKDAKNSQICEIWIVDNYASVKRAIKVK